MRLFIAVTPDDKMKRALVDTMHDLKTQGTTGNFVPVRNLHMTLAFIGECRETETIRKIMEEIPVEKARLSLAGFEYFGDVLTVGVKGNQKLKKYVSVLKNTLKENGIPCDMGKFEPHITLVRKVKGKRASVPIPKEEMTIGRVSLMKSEQKDGKTEYKEIFSVG